MTGSTEFAFDRPIRKVAIIGGGPSGVPALRHLKDSGLDATLFERQSKVGGVWNWSEDSLGPISIPTPPPSIGAFVPSTKDFGGMYKDPTHEREKRFSPPNPCYWNLSNNVPTKTMAFKDFPFPPDTPYNIPHYELAGYVQRYWAHFDLQPSTRLNTRVEKAYKREDGLWELKLRQLERVGEEVKETIWKETFDAIVNATGHYNAPFIPDIPGAGEWYTSFPQNILHSQGYRRPETYTGKTVLIIGSGTSGMDIARDLDGHVGRLLISSRIDKNAPKGYQAFRTVQATNGPKKSENIGEIRRFHPPSGGSIQDASFGTEDGRVFDRVDHVIWCTGYQYSYPYLPQYHRDAPPTHRVKEDDEIPPLVEKGDFVDNIYRDIFYIPDPTLSFIGLSVNTSAFSFFEFQSIAISRVYSSKARLPSRREQYRQLALLVAKKGKGKFRHYMGKSGEREYVQETVDWLNRDGRSFGAPHVLGHSPEWIHESDQSVVRIAEKLGLDLDAVKGFSDLSGDADPPENVEQVLDGLESLHGLGRGSHGAEEDKRVFGKEAYTNVVVVA